MPSLAISGIGFPGGYTAECLPKKNTFITRFIQMHERKINVSIIKDFRDGKAIHLDVPLAN